MAVGAVELLLRALALSEMEAVPRILAWYQPIRPWVFWVAVAVEVVQHSRVVGVASKVRLHRYVQTCQHLVVLGVL